ncbi:MAG: thiamine-binding protein [Dehalococcoidia bacterium]
MIVEIQVLPSPAGTAENKYAHIESAIAAIQASGLTYEVGALGTTIEGDPDEVWPLVRRVHEACLESGARGVISVVKFEQVADPASAPTIDSLTSKFRDRS